MNLYFLEQGLFHKIPTQDIWFYIIDINIQHFYVSWDIKDINKALEDRKKEKQSSKINNSGLKNNDLNNYSAFVNYSKKTFWR